MAQAFETTRRVEFRDTDMAGIVHFSVFFTYMEEVEHEFLRSLGLGVVTELNGQPYSWPRVAASCDYRRALKFEQLVDVRLSIERIGQKSVTYVFDFFHQGQAVAAGRLTAVCCHFQQGSPPVSVEIPARFRDRLQPFLASA